MKPLSKQLIYKIHQKALTDFKSQQWLAYEADQQMVVCVLNAANAILGLDLTFEERQVYESVDDL